MFSVSFCLILSKGEIIRHCVFCWKRSVSMCSKFFVFFLTKNSRFVVDLKLSKLNQVKVPLFFPCITSVCLQNCGVRELYFLHSFSPWNPAIHDEAREKMLTQKVCTKSRFSL